MAVMEIWKHKLDKEWSRKKNMESKYDSSASQQDLGKEPSIQENCEVGLETSDQGTLSQSNVCCTQSKTQQRGCKDPEHRVCRPVNR